MLSLFTDSFWRPLNKNFTKWHAQTPQKARGLLVAALFGAIVAISALVGSDIALVRVVIPVLYIAFLFWVSYFLYNLSQSHSRRAQQPSREHDEAVAAKGDMSGGQINQPTQIVVRGNVHGPISVDSGRGGDVQSTEQAGDDAQQDSPVEESSLATGETLVTDQDHKLWPKGKTPVRSTPIALRIDAGSMIAFHSALIEGADAVFFDAQVGLERYWFDPRFQVHLRIQQGASMVRQLQMLMDHRSELLSGESAGDLPECFATPSSRVLFLPVDREKLVDEIHDVGSQSPYSNFMLFALIHLLTGVPLAIVTSDALARIMISHTPSFGHRHLNLTMGLPTVPVEGSNEKRQGDLTKLIEKALKRMEAQKGVMKPSIDFALVGATCAAAKVWWGGLAKDKKLCYYEVPEDFGLGEEQRKKRITVGGSDFKVTIRGPYVANARTCAEKIINEVFTNVPPAEQVSTSSKVVRELVGRMLGKYSPSVRPFHDQPKMPKNVVRYVNVDYCPFALLEETWVAQLLYRMTLE